jgi:hypothetical protein
MSERIYNVKRKVTVEGEGQEQSPTGGFSISNDLQRWIIGVSAVIALIIAMVIIGLI